MKAVYRMSVQVDLETGAKLQELHNKIGRSKTEIIAEAIKHYYTMITEEK